jgi:F420-dependent oxidoreductase-like protein
MRFGLDIAQHQLSWPELLERARLAEAAGFDGAWVFDHFTALYGDPSGPCMEGWTLLAALAASTSRIRLGALVTGVTYRHPSVLTAEAVTVDHVSGGRLELGVGAAWHEPEHRALGIEFPDAAGRAHRLEEAIEVMRLLMTTGDASYDGEHYVLRDASYNPKPVQRPTPPIWIGAMGDQLMLPIVGRQADIWHSWASGERFRRKLAIVHEHAERAGRDPSEIECARGLSLSQSWDAVRQDIDEAASDGVSYLTVGWPSEGRARLEAFCSDVLPAYRT